MGLGGGGGLASRSAEVGCGAEDHDSGDALAHPFAETADVGGEEVGGFGGDGGDEGWGVGVVEFAGDHSHGAGGGLGADVDGLQEELEAVALEVAFEVACGFFGGLGAGEESHAAHGPEAFQRTAGAGGGGVEDAGVEVHSVHQAASAEMDGRELPSISVAPKRVSGTMPRARMWSMAARASAPPAAAWRRNSALRWGV